MDNLTNTIASVNSAVNDVVWGVPALTLLIGTGILMTVLTGFFQFTHFGHTMKFSTKSFLKIICSHFLHLTHKPAGSPFLLFVVETIIIVLYLN